MVYLNEEKADIWIFPGENRYDDASQVKNLANKKLEVMVLGAITADVVVFSFR